MKILIRQFLSKNHSWAVVGWGVATALINQGHDVHLFSTDGDCKQHLPSHLKPYLIGYFEENNQNKIYGRLPDHTYDMQFSYTCMKNFPFMLSNGSKNRFGTWCFEWDGQNVLPTGFAKYYHNCDYLCAPSNFAKQVFVNSCIPSDRIKVIPHGINAEQYRQTSTIDFKTNKKFKILANIAQNHLRKNIPGLLEAYGKSFTTKDDVCLILKGKDKKPSAPFEVSVSECLSNFKKKYPQHAEIKIFSEFVEDISALYRSIDACYTMTHGEGFYMPGLEAIASGKLCVAPNHGGQLDFLNHTNSLLVSGKEERANPKSMYWESKNNAIWFQPSTDDAAQKLIYASKNYEIINANINKEEILQKYDWNVIAKQLTDLCI